MKKIQYLLLFTILFANVQLLQAQEFEIPEDYAFKTAEDYPKYEKDIIKCINWLEATPVNEQTEKRKAASKFFMEYLTGSPEVSVTVGTEVTNFCTLNPELLIIFMGGWTKFVLENPSLATDEFQGNLAGFKSVIRVYTKDKSLKRDPEVDKIVAMDKKGKLEKWIREKVMVKG